MANFWQQVQPSVVQALAVLVPALTAYLVAKLRGDAGARQQAVVGAMHEVEAVHGSGMTGPEKKVLATNLAAQRLGVRDAGKLGPVVERNMPAVRERFASAPSDAPTLRERPPLP